MAVYGTLLQNNVIDDKIVTMESFMDFLYESDIQMNALFEKANLIQVLKEDNTELAIIPGKLDSSGDSEEVKKSLIEKLKELVKKFVAAVKHLFEIVAEKLNKFYMESNFQDEILSKFKDKVTWENLQKARQNGWKGIPTNIPMINKLADPSDSRLYDDMEKNVADIKEDDLNLIIRSQSLEEAKEKYKIFKERLNTFKSKMSRENADSYLRGNDIKVRWDITGDAILKAYFVISTDKSDDKHYYPNTEMFNKTKQFAENGEKGIKTIKMGYQKAINNLKIEKEVNYNNLQSFKKDGTNETSDGEANQINILYFKAKYEYSSAYITRCTRIIKAIVQVLKLQHQYSVKGYINMLMGIRRFTLKDIENTATA